jgi:hypothetical protein
MRQLMVALAVAALVLGGPATAAHAAGSEGLQTHYTVLTPEQAGLTEPAQGFFPFFAGSGQGGTPLGNGIGLGGLAPTTVGANALFNGQGGCGIFSAGFCPFFSAGPFTSTFLSQGTIGLGGPTSAGLGGLFGNNVLGGGLFGAGAGLGLGANVLGTGLTGNAFGLGLGLGANPFLTGVAGTTLGGTGTVTAGSVFAIGPGGTLIRIR